MSQTPALATLHILPRLKGHHAALRSSGDRGSFEEAEKLRGNDLRIVQRNKVSRVDHNNFGLRDQGRGSLRETFWHSFVTRTLKNDGGNQELGRHRGDGAQVLGRTPHPDPLP